MPISFFTWGPANNYGYRGQIGVCEIVRIMANGKKKDPMIRLITITAISCQISVELCK